MYSVYSELINHIKILERGQVIVVKCNFVRERQAINRFAVSLGFKTSNFSSGEWKENYTFYDTNINKYNKFSTVPWIKCPDYQYDYYTLAEKEKEEGELGYTIFYDYSGRIDNLEKYINDQYIIDLEYNSVIIYHSGLRLSNVYENEFRRIRNGVRKRIINNYEKDKGITVRGNKEEMDIINNIHEPGITIKSGIKFI